MSDAMQAFDWCTMCVKLGATCNGAGAPALGRGSRCAAWNPIIFEAANFPPLVDGQKEN